MPDPSKPPAASSKREGEPPAGEKRLRQTTLSFAPIPRNSHASSSSSSRGGSSSSSTASPHFRPNSYGKPYGPSRENSWSNKIQSGGRGSSAAGPSSTREPRSGAEAVQSFVETPPWSRKQRRINMSRQKFKPAGARYNPDRAQIAAETLSLIPSVVDSTAASPVSRLYAEPAPTTSLNALSPSANPQLPPSPIRVVNADTYDTAISLLNARPAPVAVLNMANAFVQGGGWLEGATAQEEQLCYRSTLIRTLARENYPLTPVSCVFSPAVAIFRTSSKHGYELYSSLDPPREPDIVSVLSVAAEQMPELDETGQEYAVPADRAMMKSKVRMMLRTAAKEGIRRLVLGALGCGAFLNPNVAVAKCFREVFAEAEFHGWWDEVVFAVLDDAAGNFAVFKHVLDGFEVNGAKRPRGEGHVLGTA